ncbi:Pol polyprotein [Cucumispora dikerogammari]|nr:Pol polyprotein [Cucumispora dikerogammari]
MIDSFFKFALCCPVERKISENFLKAFKHLYYREGGWKIVHSDNCREFVANRVVDFIGHIESEQVHGALYRPQTQGQIERFNRTLKSKIRRYLGTDNRRYIEILNEIVFQYNKTKHKATQISLFVLFQGYDSSNTN